MKTDQIARVSDLRSKFLAGHMSLESFKSHVASVLLEGTSPAPSLNSDDPPEGSEPPTHMHVWNGTSWVLPNLEPVTIEDDPDPGVNDG